MWRAKRIALDHERGQRMTDNEVVQSISRVNQSGDGAPSPTLHAVTTCRVCKQSSLVAGGIETPLREASRERLLCDSADAGDLESEDGPRLTSEIPAQIRRRVLIRDRFACTVPGCTSCRNIDLHHIVLRSNGGRHTMGNLTTLCSGHHTEVHEGLLVIRGTAPDRLVFEFRRSGEDEPHRVLTTVPQQLAVIEYERDVPRGTDDGAVPRVTDHDSVPRGRSHRGR